MGITIQNCLLATVAITISLKIGPNSGKTGKKFLLCNSKSITFHSNN